MTGVLQSLDSGEAHMTQTFDTLVSQFVQMWRQKTGDFVRALLEAYGALWVIVESVGFFSPNFTAKGAGWLLAFSIIAVSFAFWRAWPARRVEFQIPASDTLCEVRFGDVLEGPGLVVIAVNEYFDSELGDLVSADTLHGQFIETKLAGRSQYFDQLTNAALVEVEPIGSVTRVRGKCDKYAIGTVACVDVQDTRYLLAALSHTDLRTLKASATVTDLWNCLTGIWCASRQHSNGQPVKIPLIGSGQSGVGLPPRHLVEVIMASLLYHTKKKRIANNISLVLPRRLDNILDLGAIKRSWS